MIRAARFRGFGPVLRRELTSSWAVPLTAASLTVGCAWQLTVSKLVVDDSSLVVVLYLGVILAGAPLAVRRLLAEAENGAFLSSRPATRLGALLAKGTATAIDLAVLAVPAWWLAACIETSLGAWTQYRLEISQAVPLRHGMLLGLLATAAAGFGVFVCVRSVWVAGGLTLLACFVSVTILRRADSELAMQIALGSIGVLPLVAAVWWGSPSREGEP